MTSVETVEQMADELSSRDQMRLIAHLSERLAKNGEGFQTPSYKERLLAALALCDSIAAKIGGEFDSAADLDMIRRERSER